MNARNIRPASHKKARPGVHPRDYSPAEDALMLARYPTASAADLLEALPGRTRLSIQRRAQRLGLKKEVHRVKPWPDKDIDLLKQHYATEGTAYVAQLVKRTPHAVRMTAYRMGLTAPQAGRPAKLNQFERWPAEQLDVVRRQYPELGARTLASMLNKPINQLYACARFLGVCRLPKDQQPPIRSWVQPVKKAPAATAPAKKPQPPKPTPAPPPVKKSPATPNLNAQKAITKAAAAPKPSQYVTAEQVKRLSANHPARWAWTAAARNGPAAATKAFHAAMAAPPAGAAC